MGLALFDSNIVTDALNGYTQAIEEISYFSDIAISAVAWVEVMAQPLADSARGNPNRASVEFAHHPQQAGLLRLERPSPV